LERLRGLTLTTTPADTPLLARGIGTYVSFQPNDGNGIRPTPYSTDMSVDPATYAAVADTVNISQPHGIGYVWNSMLWEVYWNLVDKHGYNADVYAPWNEGGNNLAIQLVMDGMKIQPCSPGFVDGRDAILAADVALTGGENQCEIWRGFAKRGLGAGASQGSSNSRTDGVESFALPAACSATFGGFDSPVGGGLNEANAGSTVPLKFTASGMGSETPRIDSQPIDCATQLIEGGPVVPIELPGNSQISSDGDVFHVNWKTDPSWSGTCRKVTVRLAGASDGTAVFRFP
jgi:extracellular elastinolytic metalloproteinase